MGESGTPPSLHRYLYAYSNPTVYVDLYGYANRRAGDHPSIAFTPALMPLNAHFALRDSQAIRDKAAEFSIENTPGKTKVVAAYGASFIAVPLAPLIGESALGTYITAESGLASGTGIGWALARGGITALSGLNLYMLATNDDYKAMYMSGALASGTNMAESVAAETQAVYNGVRSGITKVANAGKTVANNVANKLRETKNTLTEFAGRLKPKNWKNWSLAEPNTLGMGGGNVKLKYNKPNNGTVKGAESAYNRSVGINGQRRSWEAKNGTTAVIRGENTTTGEVRNFVSTESPTMPRELRGKLNEGEEFIEGVGHAEQTIIENVGQEWRLFEGGSSRNVCNPICKPKIEDSGMKLGGPTYRKRGDKSPFRWFWEG